MFLNTNKCTGWPYNYVLQVAHEFQSSVCFALQTAVSELQGILRRVHRITPNDIEHYDVKATT